MSAEFSISYVAFVVVMKRRKKDFCCVVNWILSRCFTVDS